MGGAPGQTPEEERADHPEAGERPVGPDDPEIEDVALEAVTVGQVEQAGAVGAVADEDHPGQVARTVDLDADP